jgi:hypothetical protein
LDEDADLQRNFHVVELDKWRIPAAKAAQTEPLNSAEAGKNLGILEYRE